MFVRGIGHLVRVPQPCIFSPADIPRYTPLID